MSIFCKGEEMGDKKKVFVTRKIDPEAIELMKDSGFDVHVWEG